MKNTRPSIDGFVPRNAAARLGDRHTDQGRKETAPERERQQHHTGTDESVTNLAQFPSETTLGNSSIRESLRSLDDEPEAPKRSRRARRKERAALKKKSKARRIIKWVAITLLVVAVAIVGYLGVKAFLTSNKVFQGNFFDLAQKQPLKQDANGRSNFVIFGTAEDDEGGEHGGANLTDSIMVLSVNQTTKDAFMVSIPRDLWVKYGNACLSGYEGKINEVYSCFSDDGKDEKAGAKALQEKVGSILGLDIQYYIHLNFTAVVDAVNAVGGVDVTIKSEDPRGILDRNFDWKCGYRCHFVNYKNGQQVHLDGEHALALARARNAAGGYGLPNGNFDREKNQQMILTALKEKAMSAGTFTNLGKVTGLMDALGDNLRTNIETKEIQTLMGLANDIKGDAISSISLNDEEAPLVKTGMIGAASTVIPVAGTYNYSAIQARIAKASINNPVAKEGAKVVVLNGTNTAGVAQKEADALQAKGYTIGAVDNAPDGTYQSAEIYQIGEGNTATASALKERYGVSTIKTGTPPVPVAADVSFVVIVGKVRE